LRDPADAHVNAPSARNGDIGKANGG